MQKHNQEKKKNKSSPIIMPSKIPLRLRCENWQMCSFPQPFPSMTPQNKQKQWLIISRRKCFFFSSSLRLSAKLGNFSTVFIKCLLRVSNCSLKTKLQMYFFFLTRSSMTHQKRSPVHQLRLKTGKYILADNHW